MVIITILILEEAVFKDKKVKVLEYSWAKTVNQYLYFEMTEFWTQNIDLCIRLFLQHKHLFIWAAIHMFLIKAI